MNNGDKPVDEYLTKREHFAAMAMQGLLSSWPENSSIDTHAAAAQLTAESAIDFADALLAALEGEK